MNPINLITNLLLLSSFHTFVQLLNALSFNTALSNPLTLTILNLTFSILLFTRNPASNSSDLSEQLSSTLNSILDIHAPLKSKTVVLRPHTPWINPEILAAKRERSRLERSWRRWKSPFDRKKFRAHCNFVRLLLLLMQVFYTPNVRQYYMSESQTWNHHMTSYKNDDSNNRVLSFRLKHATLSDCLISISILFQTLGAATEKARDAIFVRHLGMLSNCFWLDLRDLDGL